ncbi:gluconokinase [Mycobacterium kiyosense]|uniref:Gluconokinase n=1 Tax=Mycobacterium kiyosense TaxID=2871094 RepID=A0A9P3Q0C8_9MYCO|nr:gluconokinase [Mycobacterium kiyosense]BDE14412.1 gluconokinase [Mycobacterium sp. 20KCMC460]GLB83244.1 gluconokinase [Mycobacterium kiyosense]GLB91252.1 gluconokinase [Mycobacterium kiyosense]GLB97860.1 gluconokinase [Mycobacterium kiyosense]
MVMGVSGSGKSTVGAVLAQRLGMPFLDADTLHPPANVAKMSAGEPLTDDDRFGWLDRVGQWLATQRGVVSCSALKRRYRDQLRGHRPSVRFLHLSAPPGVIAARLAARPDHFMPATLLQSQLDTLEPLDADERGVEVDVGSLGVDAVVDAYLASASNACGGW